MALHYGLSFKASFTVTSVLISISIMGEDAEVAEEYKYPSVHLENRLDLKISSDAVNEKTQQILLLKEA